MNRRLLAFLCILAIFAALLVSCQSEPEEKRAVVTVASMNDNQPYLCDVLEQGDSVYQQDGTTPVTHDDYLKEDWIPVLFYNRPYNPFIISPPGYPYGEYLVTRYRVEWERSDGGPASEVPPTYDGATSVSVPSGEMVEASMVLVPYEVKLMPFMLALRYDWYTFPGIVSPDDEILCIAHLTFWGHEVGTGRETLFRASVSVNFADIVRKSKREY